MKQLIPYQQHPNPSLQTAWNVLQLAVLVLPFSSLLASLGALIAAIAVWKQNYRKIVRRPLNQGFVVLSLLMVLSSLWALKWTDACLGLFNFLPFFFVFAGLSELIQTIAQLRRLAWILVATSIPVVAIGFGQLFLGLAGHVQFLGLLFDWTIDPTGNPPGRMSSIFYYANVLASYLVVIFTLSLGLWVEAISTPRKLNNEYNPYSLHLTPYTLFLSLVVLCNGAALILTNSRNAWAIAILVCLAFALYRGWYLLLAGVGVVTTAVLGAAFAPVPLQSWLRSIVPAFFWARLTDQLYPDRPIAQLRTTQWKFAWSLAQQHPLTGWGLRNFSPIYENQMHYFIGHPHNLLLMLAAETGFPATILFFSLVGWVMMKGAVFLVAWGRANTTNSKSDSRDQVIFFSYLAAFMGCSLFSLLDITLFDVRINLLGWLLLSAICGMVYRSQGKVQGGVGAGM